METRRVVITGLGAICSIGKNVNEFWRSCLEGRTRVESIPSSWENYAEYKSKLWSPLPALDLNAAGIKRIERLENDEVSLYTTAALNEALQSAGFVLNLKDEKTNSYIVSGLDQERAGIFIGTASFGVKSFLDDYSYQVLSNRKKELTKLAEGAADLTEKRALESVLEKLKHPRRFSPFAVSRMMPNAMGAMSGIRYSINGPNVTYALACAAGTASIGHAFRAVRDGYVDTALAGGCDYWDDQYGAIFRGFDVANTLAQRPQVGSEANCPFDECRSGFLFSQGGAAMMVLEEYTTAVNRGAEMIAEVKGYGETFDAHSMMSLEPDGVYVEKMIRRALVDADVGPADIDYVNAHGTGTLQNDEIECAVIDRVFGREVLVNSTKSLLGHTFGASGALEAVVTALSIKHGTTHLCLNLKNPLRPLNFVREVKPFTIRTALTQSFAFGGHNAGLVFARVEG